MLELHTAEGNVNLVTLGLVASGFLAPTVLRAAGAFVDRIIMLVLVLKGRPVPPRAFLLPFVEPKASIREAGVVIVTGMLCFAGLALTH